MKKTFFSAIILASAIASANPMECQQYEPRDSTPTALKPQGSLSAGTITINNQELTVNLTTANSVLQSINSVTLKLDSWLSASYWEAYSNLDDQYLSYGVYFEKDWRDSAEPTVAVLVEVDDMKNLTATRMVMLCTAP